MFPWQHAGQQQFRRLYIGAAADADEATIDADEAIIDADEAIIDADEATIDADEATIDADIIHADEAPTDVAILEKKWTPGESSCSLTHFVPLSNNKTWFKCNLNDVNHT